MQQYMLKNVLSDGQEKYYSVEYTIFDAASGKSIALEKDYGTLIDAVKVDFSSAYFALVKTAIVNKTSLSDENQVITYYQAVVGEEIELEPIVSYDYVKYGKIVGFVGINLMTSGGTQSGLIDFKGKPVGNFDLKFGQKISTNDYSSKSVVVTSLMGLKGVNDTAGNVLCQTKYEKISPLYDSHYIGKFAGRYYLLDENGTETLIANFAEDFEDYVFSGIGYYFTKNADETFNVYGMNGQLKKENVNVTIKYQSSTNQVVLNLGEDLLAVKPLRKIYVQVIDEISPVQNVAATLYNVAPYFVGDETIGLNTTENSNVIKTFELNENGVGKMDISYQINPALSWKDWYETNRRFRSYASLNLKERSLIPALDFDDGTEK